MQPEDQCPPRHPLLRMTSEKLRSSFHIRILERMRCLILENNLADVTSQTQETKSRISERRSIFKLCAQSDLADVTTPRFHFVPPMWKLLVFSWLSLYNNSSPSWRVSLCSLYPSERLPGAWLGNPELVHRTVT